MALQVFSPYGVFVIWAAFPFTEYEAQLWIRYPGEYKNAFDIKIIECDSEDYAFKLTQILNH